MRRSRMVKRLAAGVAAFALWSGAAFADDFPVTPLEDATVPPAAAPQSPKALAPADDSDAIPATPIVVPPKDDLQSEIDRETDSPPPRPQPAPAARRAPPPKPGSRDEAAKNASAAASAARLLGAGKKVDGVEMPKVPADVIPPPDLSPEQEKSLREAQTIEMVPGTTEIINVPLGFANRFVTPFATPWVVENDGEVQVKRSGNAIYVATNKPTTLFIKPDKDDESAVLSLALIPQRIPPHDIHLTLAKGVTWSESGAHNKKAGHWEEAQPYEETIRGALRSLALGNLPDGYQMRPVSAGDRLPLCRAPEGITFGFESGQMLTGDHLSIAVGVVRNRSETAVQLREPWCQGRDIAGVAFWPRPVLEPGQATEVYVVRRDEVQAEPSPRRPSLLEGGGL